MLSLCPWTRDVAFRVLEYVENRMNGATIAELARELQLGISDVLSAVQSDPWLAIEGSAQEPENALVCMDLT